MKNSTLWKRLLSGLMAILLMISPLLNGSIVSASESNYLDSLDFSSNNLYNFPEDGDTDVDLDGWDFVLNNATCDITTETVGGVSQEAIKVTKSDTENTVLDYHVALESGKDYTVSFWLKIEGTLSDALYLASPGVVYPDASGNNSVISCAYIGTSVYKENIVSTNDQWKKFSFTFTEPEEPAGVEVGSDAYRASGNRVRIFFPKQTEKYTCYLSGFKIQEAAEGNYFTNGNFLSHNGAANYNSAALSQVLGNQFSWGAAYSRTEVELETVMVDRNGQQVSALKLTDNVDSNGTNVDQLQIQTNQALPAGTYQLSYWAKLDAGMRIIPRIYLNGTSYISASGVTLPGGNAFNTGDWNNTTDSATEWKQFTYEFTLDSESAQGSGTMFCLRLHKGTGSVYLSDLILTKASHEHTYSSAVTAPTCGTQGYTTYTCACGNSYVADYVNATGTHSYVNGICSVCGHNVYGFDNTNWSSSDIGWNFSNIGSATVTDATATLGGVEQTVKQITKSDTGNTFFDLYEKTLETGKEYTLSFWLKIDGTTSDIFEVTTPVQKTYPDAANNQYTISGLYQSGTVYKEQINSTNDQWKKFSFTFTQTEGNNRFRFFFPKQATEYTCWLGGVNVQEANSDNYFDNGDFTTHNGAANYNSDTVNQVLGSQFSWGAAYSRYEVELETVTADRNGQQVSALKLTDNVDSNGTNVDQLQIQTNRALPAGTYQLSYWAKLDAGMRIVPRIYLNGTSYISASGVTLPGGNAFNTGDWNNTTDSATEWKQFTYEFTLDSESAQGSGTMFCLRLHKGTGSVYLSDLSLICTAPAAPEAPVSEWNLSLGGNIGVNFVMNVAETDVVSFTVAGNAAEAVKSDNTYTISLAAAQMTDEIVISVNGEALEKTYSVRQYADYILNEENDYSEEAKALVKEMLNYGAKAQTYFSYNVDNLANAGITDAGAEEVAANAAGEMVVSGKVDGIAYYGATVLFRDNVAVRYYFTVTGDISGCTFTVNGKAYTPVLKDGMYYIEVADINPQELGDAITVLVNDTLSVSYSPMNYIVRMSTKGSESLQALMQALYNYYLKAVAYTAA